MRILIDLEDGYVMGHRKWRFQLVVGGGQPTFARIFGQIRRIYGIRLQVMQREMRAPKWYVGSVANVAGGWSYGGPQLAASGSRKYQGQILVSSWDRIKFDWFQGQSKTELINLV